MKKFYESPEQEIVTFEVEDVITTSGKLPAMSDGGDIDVDTDDSDIPSLDIGDLFG